MDWRRRLDRVRPGPNPLAIVLVVAVLVGWHAYGAAVSPVVDALLLTVLAGLLLFDSLPHSDPARPR